MSTNPRVKKTERSVNKHPSSVKGKYKIKRKRSSEQEITNKRDKSEIPEGSCSSESEEYLDLEDQTSSESESIDTTMAGEKSTADIRSEIRSAIAEPDFLAMLSKAFASQITADLKDEIATVRKQGEETKISVKTNTSKIESMEHEIDEMKQVERNKNVIIRGLPAGRDVTKLAIDMMNEKLQANINGTHIRYAIRMRNGRNGNDSDETNNGPVRVALKSFDMKEKIFKNRAKLKSSNVWMSEDLTPRKSELAYKARECVRQGLALQTWTVNGTIFIKTRHGNRPTKIMTEDDLPRKSTEPTPESTQTTQKDK